MVAKTEKINARITPNLKREVEAILKKLGLTTTEAINIFFHQIVLKRGIPFDVHIPNRATKKAIMEVRARKGLVETTTEKMMQEYGLD